MRIGCLQFAPQVGDVDNNLNRADAVLNRVDPADIETLDLLVLPEMAFTGYNFKSREQIIPFLEPPGSGISSLWARTTALKYDCIVAVGYPERARRENGGEELYNSLIVVNGDGETVGNYRKSFLYYTDETWAKEGGGFYQGAIQDLGKVAMGICMDINPYRFETPWSAFEFGFHILTAKANLVIVSMAWLTQEDARTFTRLPQEPDMETLTYWVQRLEPIIRAEGEDEIIVVFANRCGVEGDAVYAGTSAVLGVQNGEVSVYGLLGRGTKELLVVNTEMPPFAKLVNRPEGPHDAAAEGSGVSDGMSESDFATAQEGASSSGRETPGRPVAASQQKNSATDHRRDHGYDEDRSAYYHNPSHHVDSGDILAPQQPVSARHARTLSETASMQDGSHSRYHHSSKGANSSGGTDSPRDGYSPKASPVYSRAASTREGYSPRFPSPREEHAPRPASRRGQYSPVVTSSRDGYSPKLASHARGNPSRVPSPRDQHGFKEPSPEEWYGVAVPSKTMSSDRTGAPVTIREWDDEGLRDLASPSFPEPTPLSMRPKLAISTGPETLPPLPKREPPRGVQAGNFFSSRDLCTPPETPFDDEPQPFIQQTWVPPSAFIYTPEEPEWPDAIKGAEGVGQLAGRRPSLGNAYPPPRAVPTRPASRTQEVKLSNFSDRRQHRADQDVVAPRHTSKSRTSSRARGPVPDRRPTPAPERSTPRLRSKRSEPSMRPAVPPAAHPSAARDVIDRRDETPKLPAVIQSLRDSASPWNSITIAASPSVFKTEFQRSETFPRSAEATQKPRQHHKGSLAGDRDGLRRSKSISAFHHDPASYLPSPALPVHKAYQDLIYSAVEPGVNADSRWAAAVAAKSRQGSVTSRSEHGARVPLGRLVRPDILSPMSV